MPKGSAQIVLGEATFALPLAGVIDIDAEQARLGKDDRQARRRDRQDRQEARQRAVRRQGRREVIEEQRERRRRGRGPPRPYRAALARLS